MKVGDKVSPGDVLCGIETDKATVDYEMQEEGYIAKIMYADGAKDVLLGEVIAILVEDEKDIKAFENFTGDAAEASTPAPAQSEPVKAAQAAPAKSYPDHIVLEMPNLSPTMEKGNIAKWNKKVGDKVQAGDSLCGIETDKATVDFEMQEEGYIAKILYPDGAKDVPLGEPLALLVDEPSDIPAFADWVAGGAAEPEAAVTPATPAAASVPSGSMQKAQSGDR